MYDNDPEADLPANPNDPATASHTPRPLGQKRYELTNHLGNVLVVITDRKRGREATLNTGDPIEWYEPDVLSSQQYYAFGMLMPSDADPYVTRQYSLNGYDYRFGFNGKEGDDEVKGDDNQQDYGMRIYDPRVGRWLSIDPLSSKFPSHGPFNFVNGNPVLHLDPDGMKWVNPYEGIKGKEEEAKVVAGLLDKLKEHDEELYNFIENLSYTEEVENNGEKQTLNRNVKVFLFLSSKERGNSDLGEDAVTDIHYSDNVKTENIIKYGENEIKVPLSPSYKNDKSRGIIKGTGYESQGLGLLKIILYKAGRDEETLANEAGDVMFSFVYNDLSVADYKATKKGDKGYRNKSATDYSFQVESAFVSRKKGTLSKDKSIYPLMYIKGKIKTKEGDDIPQN